MWLCFNWLARRSHWCLRDCKGDVCCLCSGSLIFDLKVDNTYFFESNLFVISLSDQSYIWLNLVRSARCMSNFCFPYNSDLKLITFFRFSCVLITIGLGVFIHQTFWLILITSLSLWKSWCRKSEGGIPVLSTTPKYLGDYRGVIFEYNCSYIFCRLLTMFGFNIVRYSQALHVIVWFIKHNFVCVSKFSWWLSQLRFGVSFCLTTLPHSTYCFNSKLRLCVRKVCFRTSSFKISICIWSLVMLIKKPNQTRWSLYVWVRTIEITGCIVFLVVFWIEHSWCYLVWRGNVGIISGKV